MPPSTSDSGSAIDSGWNWTAAARLAISAAIVPPRSAGAGVIGVVGGSGATATPEPLSPPPRRLRGIQPVLAAVSPGSHGAPWDLVRRFLGALLILELLGSKVPSFLVDLICSGRKATQDSPSPSVLFS